nr:Ty3/gypsy retrotransposon protein [Tanacetum cinerariifolium]
MPPPITASPSQQTSHPIRPITSPFTSLPLMFTGHTNPQTSSSAYMSPPHPNVADTGLYMSSLPPPPLLFQDNTMPYPPVANRTAYSVFYFTGEALSWYKHLFINGMLGTWETFTRELEIRFGPSSYENHEATLFKLKQTNTVSLYQTEFERLSNRVNRLSGQTLKNIFISGLKKEIQNEIVLLKPISLHQAYGQARLLEEKLAQPKPKLSYSNKTSYSSGNSMLTSSPSTTLPVNTSTSTSTTSSLPITRLSPEAMHQRKKDGLCFRCPEKYTPGHKYSPPQFLSVVDYDEDEGLAITSAPEAHMTMASQYYALSDAAFFGFSSSQTLRVTGYISRKPVSILIDCGSTHNIIQPRVATALQLISQPIAPFSVMVGNGQSIQCRGVCPNVKLQLKKANFDLPFYIIPVEGADLVQGTAASLHTITYQPPMPSTEETPTYKNLDINHLLYLFSNVFKKPTGLPPPRPHDHTIPILDDKAVNVKPYRYPDYQKQVMTQLIEEMLRDGIIRPSQSAFSSPVLLVKKKDGTWRFCVDYRALNTATIKDRFPIPTIDELLDELHGATIFSKIDLRSGYHQIRVAKEDIHKTAFRTTDGHYEFLVMPFGLTKAPSTFQSAMNDIFRTVLRKFVLVFFDDILVYSPTEEAHFKHLQHVLEMLHKNAFHAKPSKCTFGVQRLAFLGHIISAQGVEPEPEKTEAIQSWLKPRSMTTLRAFLGLTGYYRRFGKGYANVAIPLTNILRQEKFSWSDAAHNAFLQLKSDMANMITLALPNFKEEFEVTTDASGKENVVADSLSRIEHPSLFAISFPQATWLLEIKTYFADNKDGKEMAHSILTNKSSFPYHEVRNGLVFIKGRIFVPPLNDIRQRLLGEYHATPLGGHGGITTTIKRIAVDFAWLGLKQRTNGEAMINSIQNGDQPLTVIAQVSLAGNAQNAPLTLKDPKFWTAEEKKTRKIDRLARSLLIQGLPNDIYSLNDSNETVKDLWDALERQMRGSEYGEQDWKAAILYEYETFKANEGEQLLDAYLRYLQVINDLKKCGYKKDNCEMNYNFLNNLQPEWKQYGTLMRQTKNLMDINIDALYNILKKNQGDVNDALGYKKKVVVVTSFPLALVAEKTNVSKRKEKVVVSSDSKGSEFVKSNDKKEDKKFDEKKRDLSKVKCYNCKKEGHFAKDCKKAKIKDYDYYKIKMSLAKKDSDEQVLLAEDQAWMECSSDSDQEINANMVFMAQIEKVLSDSDNNSSSAEETIAEVAYYTSESESEFKFETSEYYDNSTNYGLFVNNDDDQEIFHDAIESAVKISLKIILVLKKTMIKWIGFENPRYFEKAKDLRPSLYDEKVIGLGYTSMFLTHSDEALEIEKFKRAKENKIEFAYDYENLNASYQTSSLKPYIPNVILEKIIIDLEDEVATFASKGCLALSIYFVVLKMLTKRAFCFYESIVKQGMLDLWGKLLLMVDADGAPEVDDVATFKKQVRISSGMSE